MAEYRVIAPLAARIIDATNAWSGIAGQLSGLVTAPVTAGVTLLVMWHGFNIVRGAGGQHHLLDVFAKCVRALLVMGLALSAGAYSSNVVGFFQDLRSELTGMFVRGTSTSYEALDAAVSAGLSSWDPTWNWASDNITIMSTSPNFAGVVALGCWFFMIAALTVFAAVCAINLIVIDFALALIFALGPIFVACFAFQATARFTDAWLGAVLKYTFTAVVVSAVIGIGIGILQSYTGALASSAGALDFVTAAFSAVGATLILGVLATKIPQIAGDMVGGIGISAFGPAMAARPMAAVVGATAGSAANGTAYLAGRAAASAPAQAIGATTLGTRVASAFRGGGFFDAVRSNGIGSAYALGRSHAAGIGIISGGSRPVGQTHTPGGG